MVASSECYDNVASFLGDFQLCCLALVLVGCDVVVVVVVVLVMRGGDAVVVFQCGGGDGGGVDVLLGW